MSGAGLRQVKKDTTTTLEEDVEAQDKGKGKVGPSSPKAATAFAASSLSGGGSASAHNPVLIAKVIFQKVVTLLVSSDEEDLTQPGGIVTLLKDIIMGVVLGVITISLLIFLDHRNVVHFQSAHNFRNAAFQLLNDPETISTLEDSSDLKFMTVIDYDAKRKEIDSVADKLKGHEEILAKRTSEADAKKAEVDAIMAEHAALMKNELLALDKYCGGCSWSGKTTCDTRMKFLIDTYNTRPIMAKTSAMGHPSCKK